MKLNFTIICDNAFTDQQGRLNIIQIFEHISSKSYPATYPRMVIVTNYSVTEEEKNKEYIQILEITERKTKKVLSTTNPISIVPTENVNNMNYLCYFNGLTFTDPGDYDVTIKINGGKIGSVSFLVE